MSGASATGGGAGGAAGRDTGPRLLPPSRPRSSGPPAMVGPGPAGPGTTPRTTIPATTMGARRRGSRRRRASTLDGLWCRSPATIPFLDIPWSDLLFVLLAGVMLVSALLVVTMRDIIRCGLALIVCFAALAGLYVLLGRPCWPRPRCSSTSGRSPS